MDAYGMLARDGDGEHGGSCCLDVLDFSIASEEDLSRAHTDDYLHALRAASADPAAWPAPAFGLGTADDPVTPGIMEAAALVAGATSAALKAVIDGRYRRAFAPAGGLHHAHADHASGFCLVNDVAVAIARSLARDPDLRVAYIDIDAHHGDGVQSIFYDDPRVLTVSVHESGRFLFPGSGFPDETGGPSAPGSAGNVALPPGSGDDAFHLAFTAFVDPVVTAFRPDVIVAQLGADAHHDDPLTTLGLTLAGHADLVDSICGLADSVCDGRIAATGGGGYSFRSVVPRAWCSAAARLGELALPEPLPESWRRALRAHLAAPPHDLHEDHDPADRAAAAATLALAQRAVDDSRRALFPVLGLRG
jgi:acetoin utilization protein AcuC